MYLPAHFGESDPAALRHLIESHPLGILVTQHEGLADANHLPFELDAEQGLLRAHVARANPVWQQADGAEVLVIFRGAEAYISPTWYPSKPETQRHVPTWNYQVVHVRGRLRVRDDERFVRGLVGRLTRTHEAGEEKPWKMADAPRDYIEQMLAAIVGLEIEIGEMTGKFKLGQNREPRDRLGAAAELQARGAEELGAAMQGAGKTE